MAYAGKYGALFLSATGASTAFTDEATTANATRTVYQITSTSKRYWDPATAIVVEVDGTAIAATEYTIAYAGGKIIFKVARAEGAVVTVTGGYLTVAQFAECHEWKMDVKTDMIETPKFQSDYKHYIDGQTGITGSFSHWFTVAAGAWFLTRLTAKRPLLLLLYDQYATGIDERFELCAYLDGDSISLMQSGAVDESISFTGTGAINYATA